MNNRIDELALKVIALARNTAAVNLRFMQSAISMLVPEKYDGKITTDGRKLYYDPVYILRAYKTDKNYPERWFLHILLHCVFRHWFVTELIDTELWDLACDIAVESIINELGVNKIRQCQEQINAAEKLREKTKFLTAEKLYNYLINNPLSENELNQLKKLFSFDEHSLWYQRKPHDDTGDGSGNGDSDENNKTQADSSGDNQGNSDGQDKMGDDSQMNSAAARLAAEWQEISEIMQTDLETFAKDKGEKAGTLVQNLTAVNREKYDYTTFLRKFAVMHETMKVNDDEFDYIFYTYGMKLYDRMPLIEPLEYKDDKRIHDFVIAIDTSGSVSGELVQAFVKKTYNILKQSESFDSRINVHIIQCDTEIQEDVRITSQEEFDRYLKVMELKGFGGTDFRPVFSYVDKLVKNHEFSELRGLIFFTDGYGCFPERQPQYKTAFIFIDDDYNNYDVPVWAIKLILQRNEI